MFRKSQKDVVISVKIPLAELKVIDLGISLVSKVPF